jgi:hypothetical protein
LRLVRIHGVGPGREVGIISDRHQGILSAVLEQIPGYAPLHHCMVAVGDRRLSLDLPRCTVNLIGGELDVDDPRL